MATIEQELLNFRIAFSLRLFERRLERDRNKIQALQHIKIKRTMNPEFLMSRKMKRDFYDDMAKDLAYDRNHPLMENWRDWQSIVYEYYSKSIAEDLREVWEVMTQIGKPFGRCATPYDQREIIVTTNNMLKYTQMYYRYVHEASSPSIQQWEDYFFSPTCYKYSNSYTLNKEPCTFMHTEEGLSIEKCPNKLSHIRGRLLAAIAVYTREFDKPFKNPKQMIIYFSCLIRLILSLPFKRLKNIHSELLLNWRKYLLRRRSKKSFLNHMYSRGFLDRFNAEDIAHCISQLTFKEMPKEQSGPACQRRSESIIFNEEFYSLAERVLSPLSLEQILLPQEQGWFTVTQEHIFPAEGLTHLKDMVFETQNTFLKQFGETLVCSAKRMSVIFAVGATTAVIMKHAIGMGFDLIRKILSFIYSLLFPSINKEVTVTFAVEQSADGISVPLLPAVVTEYMIDPPQQLLSKIWNNPNIDKTFRRIGYLGDPKVDRGLERIIENVQLVIDRTFRWFCKEVFGIERPADLSRDIHVIEEFYDEFDKLTNDYYSETFVWSSTNFAVTRNLYSRGMTIARTPAYQRWKNDIMKCVVQLGSLLEKFKAHNKEGYSARDPPVTIYLSGGSGVGKSSLTYPFAVEVLKKIFEREGTDHNLKETWKNFIYMRSPEQEYWDGYTDQLVTVFDDFNQQADSASNPSLELFEIIRAANVFPYPLHMAHLDQKANTTFNSRIIIVSSNMDKPKSQSLNFPQALYNRLNISVRITRANGYKDYKGPFTPNAYKIEQYDITTGKTIKDITYEQLVDMAVEQYFGQTQFVQSMDQYISSLFDPIPEEQGGDCAHDCSWRERYEIKNLYDLRQDLKKPEMEQYITPTKCDCTYNDYRAHRDWVTQPFCKCVKLNPVDKVAEGVVSWTSWWMSLPGRVLHKISPKWYWRAEEKTVEISHAVDHRMQDLWTARENLDNKLLSVRSWWQKFREEHPYIFQAVKIGAYIGVGLAFLKLALSFLKPKESKLITEEAALNISPKRIRPRSIQKEQIATPEGYSVNLPRTAKVEGYQTTTLKNAKIESPLEEGNYPSDVKFMTTHATEQGIKDLNASEILGSVVRSNLYKIYESTLDAPIGHCLFLKGQICLMPKHYLKYFRQSLRNDPNAFLYFRSVLLGRAYEIRIDELLKTRIDYDSPDEHVSMPITKDLMTVVVTTSCVHKDITAYFVSRKSLIGVNTNEIVLPVAMNNDYAKSQTDVLLLRYRKAASSLMRVPELPITNKEGVPTRRIRDAWRYEADTEPTECGSPLIVRNKNVSPGKICGIHVAGIQGTGEGFAVPLYDEDIARIMDQRKRFMENKIAREREIVTLGKPVEQGGQIPPTAVFIRLGQVFKGVAQPSKTKIRPSLVYGKLTKPKTKPCQLRPTEEFDPRAYRLGRLGNVPRALSRGAIENAQAALLDHLSPIFARKRKDIGIEYLPVYSFEQAVTGIPGSDYVTSIKRKTSPGYPFVTQQGWKTRWEIFGYDDNFDLNTDKAKALKWRVETIVEKAKKGISLDHTFVDTLKDERKPVHKAHKTRMFSAGPLDYLIACKQYFNGPVALFQLCRNQSGVSVGVNPYSEDWGEIVRTILRKSQHVVAGDFEGFDASQHRSILEKAGEVFVEISKRHLGASEEDCNVMRVLLIALLDSVHLLGDELYQWTHSLPSGHYLTAPINSIFVLLSFCVMWMHYRNDFSYLTAREFYDECGLVAYGDDHLLTIPEKYLDGFSQLTIPDFARRIGLSYTMEVKEAVATQPSRTIEEVSYLRRSFRRDDTGRWLAPLDLDVILETPMWVHETPDMQAQTIENLEWGLKELSLHDEATWNTWSPRFFELLEELNHYTIWKYQAEVRNEVLSTKLEM